MTTVTEWTEWLGVWKKAGERSMVTKADINQPEIGKVIVTFRYDITGLDSEKIAGYSTLILFTDQRM